MTDPREFWNERYSSAGFMYGTDPNDLIREVAPRLTGPVLSLGEGEGRNGVFLAQRGLDVTAVDVSPVGLEKAARLASERGVPLKTITADLATFDLGVARWGTIISIWCHIPPEVRRRVFGAIATALRPGGHFILEAYTPRQLKFETGGPKNVELLCEPEEVKRELMGMTFERCVEMERDVHEGAHHAGKSAVVQIIATPQ